MIRRQPKQREAITPGGGLEGIHKWVLSLPWVVERPRDASAPKARTFAVDCEPLGYRRIWLVTGIHDERDWGGTDLAVVLPAGAAALVVADGEGQCVAFLQGGRVLVDLSTNPARPPTEVERLLWDAYGYAMSAPNGPDMR